MLRLILCVLALCLVLPQAGRAQDLQTILQTHAEEVAKPGRRTVGVVIDDLAASGLPQAVTFLEAWRDREIVQRDSDGLFFRVGEGDPVPLFDLDTGELVAEVDKGDVSAVRPNGGVRRAIGEALVQFQLLDPDIEKRTAAVDAIARSMEAAQLPALQASIDAEPDVALKARKERLVGMLQARFADTTEERVAAIEALSGDLSVDVRATLNTILSTTGPMIAPETGNIAQIVQPGTDALSVAAAYDLIVEAGMAQPIPDAEARKAAIIENIDGDQVAGVPVADLSDQANRDRAYVALIEAGLVPETDWRPGTFSKADAVAETQFALVYDEDDAAVTAAAEEALAAIETQVGVSQVVDLGLDALSLASIYFLAAIGLAITFGVMGVINMAHGEFIMMGAYTGYVVQLFVPDYTLSIIIALPLAFAVTFGAGVAMERLVIRWLYHRPLETLLATFGISIALQQLAKNIFGTQARPLTSPEWLDGALVINDVIGISYIRIAIFVLALIFLVLILFILNRTRLGLEVRSVTQNPGMAASMGINPDRINMLTFGLGSGIAGIAGVAIGLYAKVTSEMGADYIVQSFMTVVVGGITQPEVWKLS